MRLFAPSGKDSLRLRGVSGSRRTSLPDRCQAGGVTIWYRRVSKDNYNHTLSRLIGMTPPSREEVSYLHCGKEGRKNSPLTRGVAQPKVETGRVRNSSDPLQIYSKPTILRSGQALTRTLYYYHESSLYPILREEGRKSSPLTRGVAQPKVETGCVRNSSDPLQIYSKPSILRSGQAVIPPSAVALTRTLIFPSRAFLRKEGKRLCEPGFILTPFEQAERIKVGMTALITHPVFDNQRLSNRPLLVEGNLSHHRCELCEPGFHNPANGGGPDRHSLIRKT